MWYKIMEEYKMTRIKINPISKQMYVNLQKLQKWQETPIKKGEAISKHSHQFNAMYFTENVKELCSGNERIKLPKRAAVFIPLGFEHGWNDTLINSGKVGHFHEGHGIHAVVPAY